MRDVDALIMPTTQVLPFSVDQEYVTRINDEDLETYLDWMKSCSRITVTSHPALSLPAGFAGDLPVGAQIVGRYRDDVGVLNIAHAIEQATHYARRLPAEDA